MTKEVISEKWEVMSDKWEVRSEKLTAVFVNRNGNVVILQQKRQEWRARRSQATHTERKGREREAKKRFASEEWIVKSSIKREQS